MDIEAIQKKLEKLCSRRPVPASNQFNCDLLTIILDEKKEALKRDAQQLDLINLGARRAQAIIYVMEKTLLIVCEAILLSNALRRASDEYDLILSVKATKPILGEVIFSLALTALPQLGVIAKGIEKFGGPAARSFIKLENSSSDMWNRTVSHLANIQIKPVGENTKRFLDTLDSSSKDIIEAFIDPMKAKADVDAETSERLSKFATKNQILGELIRSIEKRIVIIQRFQWIVNLLIYSYEGEDLLERVQTVMKTMGYDDSGLYEPGLYEKFSHLILYDMLRAYAKTNCKFVTSWDSRKDFEGLDKAQRKLIFDRFSSEKWKSIPNFPALNNDQDLIHYFGIKTEHKQMPHLPRVA